MTLSTFLVLGSAADLRAAKSCSRGFLVFAGEDAKGHVLFAMEATQSTGARWDWMQAAQAAWLYDEASGWVRLKDRYGKGVGGDNGKRIGGDFEGNFANGFQQRMTIHSDLNRIYLAMRADKVALQTRGKEGQLLIAHGDATLRWMERRITGKVYLRTTKTPDMGATQLYVQNCKGMRSEALYLGVGTTGFMSVLRSNERSVAPLSGPQSLALSLDSIHGLATELQLEATAWQRHGLYEYPTEWQGTFMLDGRGAMFKVTTEQTEKTEFLLFANAQFLQVRGFLSFDGESYPIYGVADVAGRWQGRKQIEAAELAAKPAHPLAPGISWDAAVR